MDPIVVIDDWPTLYDLAAGLIAAADKSQPVRFAIDDGGLKLSIGRGTWTPPLGQVTP